MEAFGESRERPAQEEVKELRDELIPAYTYILELLIKEIEEEEEKAKRDEHTLYHVKKKISSARRPHPWDLG